MTQKIQFLLLIVAALFVQGAFAQQATVSGTVTDEAGIPIPAVNIIEKGTTNGTSADFDGNYSFNVANGATLVFSALGYATQETPVGSESTINITYISM